MHGEVVADRSRDATEIVWVARHDQIIAGKGGDHDRRIDQIAPPARRQRQPGRACLLLGERLDETSVHELRQPRLGPAPPSLAKHNRRKRWMRPTFKQTPVQPPY